VLSRGFIRDDNGKLQFLDHQIHHPKMAQYHHLHQIQYLMFPLLFLHLLDKCHHYPHHQHRQYL
jgi:hypothetical protein